MYRCSAGGLEVDRKQPHSIGQNLVTRFTFEEPGNGVFLLCLSLSLPHREQLAIASVQERSYNGLGYWFIKQIFTEHLVWTKHCSRCWTHSGE